MQTLVTGKDRANSGQENMTNQSGEGMQEEVQQEFTDENKVMELIQENAKAETNPQPADRHKQAECKVCCRKMRSDNLTRHMKTHQKLLTVEENDMREEIRRRNQLRYTREEQEREEGLPPSEYCDTPSTIPFVLRNGKNVREEMQLNRKENVANIELGKEFATYIIEDNIPEGSLSREHKLALDLYRKERSLQDFSEVQLKTWQQKLMNIFDEKSDREVIWVIGKKGNEGKSWFQDYLESCFGFNRVSRIDFRIKHANMCNVLKKKPLTTVDIFLFNDGRSITEDENSDHYRILENIKDGQATTSKYNNDVIKFKKPNTVMVFSNTLPIQTNLSLDRWKVFRIVKNVLIQGNLVTK